MSSTTEIYGQGIKYPCEADGAGRLVLSSGIDRLWESIESILDTYKGTCPMDPEYGVELLGYELVRDASRIGWEIANAIDRSEPRLKKVKVDIVGYDVDQGALRVRITIWPISEQNQYNRIYPVYGLVT